MIKKIARLPDWPVATRRELRDGLSDARRRVVEVLTADDLATLLTQAPDWALGITEDLRRPDLPPELAVVLAKLEGFGDDECTIILACLMDTRDRLNATAARSQTSRLDPSEVP